MLQTCLLDMTQYGWKNYRGDQYNLLNKQQNKENHIHQQ